MPKSRLFPSIILAALTVSAACLSADERRAPAPKISQDQLRGVFFDNLRDAFRGTRPTLADVRKNAGAAATPMATASTPQADAGTDVWTSLITPTSLEDEVKRVRLHYDSVVTTPGAFNSGGYQDARLDLTVLATLFAVIHEHGGDVRWKEQASAARDLIARTAFNCKAGSTQVYNEAKLRKADLRDLVSGSGLASRDAEPGNDWAMIADRSPLMEYADGLIETLEDATRDEASVRSDPDLVKRNAELLAVLGAVFAQEGMDEAEDDDYVALSRGMTSASTAVVAAIDRSDADAVRKGTSAIRQRCDVCHEQYR